MVLDIHVLYVHFLFQTFVEFVDVKVPQTNRYTTHVCVQAVSSLFIRTGKRTDKLNSIYWIVIITKRTHSTVTYKTL